jgi:hypothetical protein
MYHLVFVVQNTLATSSDIAFYNTFVNDRADMVPELREFTWFAIGSTATVNARDNALISAPVYRLDAIKVADGIDDMWDGSLDASISINQFGEFDDTIVWTGTTSSGLSAPRQALGQGSLGGVILGESTSVTSSWIQHFIVGDGTSGGALYALSGKLTVPVPEPSSQTCIWLMLLCGGVAYTWRRRRTAADFFGFSDTLHR